MDRVVVIGVGNVGASFAYAMMMQGTSDEIVLIDRKFDFADAHAQDMNHSNTFLTKQIKIRAGNYSDCKDAKIVCITAGLPQKEGQTRLDLAQDNAMLMKMIVEQIMESGFDGILLIATNPVDVMTHVAQKVSKLPHSRVIGSGTTLDSARFRQNLAQYFDVNPKHVHAKVIGEHGDSSVALWSSAYIGPKPILDLVNENPDKYKFEDLNKAYEDARDAAYDIIKQKGSTYYGIGASLNYITKSILDDQKNVASLSSYLQGEYNHDDVYIAVPSLIGRDGVVEVLSLNLTSTEREKFDYSVELMKKTMNSINL